SDAEPVWKLQDPGFDQGYGSERSPEDDYVPPVAPPISLEAYEAELRTVYTFITDENTFTVVVEKDGRGLGMSVCGGGGLVRIRRLYPPQPAWRTGMLAQRDLLLSANGVPLAGLSTYEALEVLRTASARVELRVLSATTSSATTSSSEGRGRREASPEVDRRNLHLPDLDRPLPVYDIQYGVNDTPMSNMSHAEAVAFLRACGTEVRLRLYRDHAATPLSPMKLTKDNNHYEQANDATDLSTLETHTDSVERTRPLRTPSVAITSPTAPPSCRKQKLSLTVPPHGYELNNLDNDTLDAPNYQEDISRQRYAEPIFPVGSDEPVSMPVELSSDEARFKHANPTYQSAVLHTSSDGASDGHKDDGKGMKKWKGVALSPDNERKAKTDMAPLPPPPILIENDSIQKENIDPEPTMDELNTEP
ncbi:putative multiple pdz domain protein, partial [Operophtera brumata]